MIDFIDLTCNNCGKLYKESISYYEDMVKRGRQHNFCSIKCGNIYINNSRRKERKIIQKQCPTCGSLFECTVVPSYTGKNNVIKEGRIFCSRGCASKGSVTNYRREKARTTAITNKKWTSRWCAQHMSEGMKTREGWRYKVVQEELSSLGLLSDFEVPIGNFIYDLVLEDDRIIIEFDEDYHCDQKQKETDTAKTNYATSLGYKVFRINSKCNECFTSSSIEHVVCYILNKKKSVNCCRVF